MATLEEFLHDANASDIAATLPVDHLSVSQVNMLERCEEQYRQRYVLGIKARPGSALIVGSAFHKATELNYQSVIDGKELFDDEGLRWVFNDAWDAEIQKYGGVNEIEWDSREKPDTLRLNGETVTKLYAERVAPKYQPEAVEHSFSLELPGVPVPVVGFVDLLGVQIPADTNTHYFTKIAADYKTSARAQRTLKPDWKFQGEVYQVAVNRPVEWHVVVKGSKPNVITPLDSPDLFQFQEPGTEAFVTNKFRQAAARISWLMATEGPDNPWPTTGYSHAWACSFCGFKRDCPAYGGRAK